jgi:hypothetical protein
MMMVVVSWSCPKHRIIFWVQIPLLEYDLDNHYDEEDDDDDEMELCSIQRILFCFQRGMYPPFGS